MAHLRNDELTFRMMQKHVKAGFIDLAAQEGAECPNCALPPECHGLGYVCCLVYDAGIGWFEPTESVK